MSTLSAAMLLFLVLDPLGNIPLYVILLKDTPARRRPWVIVRELLIALAVLVVMMFAGRYLLAALAISQPALRIAGGLILLIIALMMVFGDPAKVTPAVMQGEPLIVPLAIPAVAGPSAMSTVILLMAQEPQMWPQWLAALGGAWLASGILLLLSSPLGRLLGSRGLSALQSLMGMLLTTVAVNMFIDGVRETMAG
jgi:multiple antibiotic resistance protein